MGYRVTGLSADPFKHLYGQSDAALKARGVLRRRADHTTAYTDRIEMRDARPGETVLLLNHVSHPADTPYRASHAIYILEGATETFESQNCLPDILSRYPQSLRAFDADGMLVDARLASGGDVEVAIGALFGNPDAAYILTHNAAQGCYAGRIDRD